MSNNTEFPFAKARRITPQEVNQAKIAIQKQFGDEYQYIVRSKEETIKLLREKRFNELDLENLYDLK